MLPCCCSFCRDKKIGLLVSHVARGSNVEFSTPASALGIEWLLTGLEFWSHEKPWRWSQFPFLHPLRRGSNQVMTITSGLRPISKDLDICSSCWTIWSELVSDYGRVDASIIKCTLCQLSTDSSGGCQRGKGGARDLVFRDQYAYASTTSIEVMSQQSTYHMT